MFKFLYFILCVSLLHYSLETEMSDDINKPATIVIAILARNKAHTLPNFLSILEKLNYPKNRITLWIRSDHNSDNTIDILKLWINSHKNNYHKVDFVFDNESKSYIDESGPAHWPVSRFNQMIKLREEALNYSRNNWADYVLFLDCDVFFVDLNVLKKLISKGLPVVAPLLKSDGLYSNFWAGMSSDYYYERTDDYKPILERDRIGCFPVPMIHSCVLIDLKHMQSDHLTFVPEIVPQYDGPRDDIITFALSVNKTGLSMHICNDNVYGFVTVPLEQNDPLEFDKQQVVNIKMEVLTDYEPLPLNDLLKTYVSYPLKDTLGFDNIFMINLKRRPERRKRMEACFQELGLQVEIYDAVDGNQLNDTILENIQFLPGYSDPYHKRPMKLGEIGCFLSHLAIWKEVLSRGYNNVLVLEDDIRFEPFFRIKTIRLLNELNSIPSWDLVYLGRKRMVRDGEGADSDVEAWVEGSSMLVHAGYSYWTLGYALNASGAQKLLRAEPLQRMLPVDEFLPVLYDRHPRTDWKQWFPRRDLVALSVAPLLVYPTHYTGEEGYISDTEDSIIIHTHNDL